MSNLAHLQGRNTKVKFMSRIWTRIRKNQSQIHNTSVGPKLAFIQLKEEKESMLLSTTIVTTSRIPFQTWT